MPNGFLIEDGELGVTTFVPLSERTDLWREPCTQILARFAGRKSTRIQCGCGMEHGKTYSLSIRKLLQSRHTLVREKIEEHSAGCVLERAGDASDEQGRLTAGIFAPVRRRADASRDGGDRSTRIAYDTFSRFSRRVISRGYSTAIGERNSQARTWDDLYYPGVGEMFASIVRAVLREEFQGGISAEQAASQHGVRFRMGLLTDRLPKGGGSESVPLGIWWWDGAGLVSEETVVPEDWVNEVEGALWIYQEPIQAPFLIVAAVEPDGTLRKVYAQPVYLGHGTMVPVDSGIERQYVAQTLPLGMPVKVMRIEDTELLPQVIRQAVSSIHEWHSRPDFFVCSRWDDGGWGFSVVEVRGFRPGQNPSYDKVWFAKQPWYRSMDLGARGRYLPIDGWLLPQLPVADWAAGVGVPVLPGGFSDAFVAAFGVF